MSPKRTGTNIRIANEKRLNASPETIHLPRQPVISCNAHMSAPKKKVRKKGGRRAVRVTFIRANIT